MSDQRAEVPSAEQVAAAYQEWQRACRRGAPDRNRLFVKYMDLRDDRLEAMYREEHDG